MFVLERWISLVLNQHVDASLATTEAAADLLVGIESSATKRPRACACSKEDKEALPPVPRAQPDDDGNVAGNDL